MPTRLDLSLDAQILLRPDGDSTATVQGRTFAHPFRQLSPGLIAIFERLAASPQPESALMETLLAHDGVGGLIAYHRLLFQLGTLGVLRRTLWVDGAALATCAPLVPAFRFRPGLAKRGTAYQLSRLAYLRQEGGQLRLETPRGLARLLLHDARGGTLIAALSQPCTAADLAAQLPAFSEEEASHFLTFLLNLEAVLPAGRDDERDPANPLGAWEFHDLLFHARSRLGRHDGRYGGTFHHRGKVPPPPLLKPPMSETIIPLPVPDLAALAETDPPFTTVLERRRSVRHYDEAQPISRAQLGELLYRAARIKQVLRTGEGEMEYALRPYPGGGAIHELELYPVIGDSADLPSGIYRYHPLAHHLEALAPRTKQVEELLHIAWQTADQKSPPQLYLVITARFQRFQWKYESMAYAAMLKHVGVLYQTLYLAATAMGLAPCALGGGPATLFCEAAGLDYYAESPIGEFMVGSRGAEP